MFVFFQGRTIANAQLIRLWYGAGRKKTGLGNAFKTGNQASFLRETAIGKAALKLYIILWQG